MKIKHILLGFGIVFTTGCGVKAQDRAVPLSKDQISARADELLSKMTIEEKVGQMTQATLDVIGKGENRYSSYEPFSLDEELVKKAVSEYHSARVGFLY